MRNWIFVKVETDQDGLYGWGEATLEWKTQGVVGAVEDIGRLLIGEDPRRIEHLYQIMCRQYFWRAGIEGMTAISGIEQALWDIKGKWLERPGLRAPRRAGARPGAGLQPPRRRLDESHVREHRGEGIRRERRWR